MLLSSIRTTALLLSAILIPLTVGCDSADDDTDLPAGAATYAGTLAGAQTSGALQVTVEGAEASGSFTVVEGAARSAMPPLAGTYNAGTGALHLEGGGYTFDGTISNGVLSGTWTGPDGTSGSFSAYLGGEGEEVAVYCGTYEESDDDGTLNIVIRGSALLGVAVNQEGRATDFRGTVSGSNVTVFLPENPAAVVATGTLSGDRSSASGTTTNGGTWEAALCGS